MSENKRAIVDLERIQTILFYMTTPHLISGDQACQLLRPLLHGSPALERVLRFHGRGTLPERCLTAVAGEQ